MLHCSIRQMWRHTFDVNTKCSWSHTLLAVDTTDNCLACPCMHNTHKGGCVTVKLSQSRWGAQEWLYSFLTLVLDGCVLSTLRPGYFIPSNGHWYQLNRRLGESQNESWWFREEKLSQLRQDSNPVSSNLLLSCYTNTIPTHQDGCIMVPTALADLGLCATLNVELNFIPIQKNKQNHSSVHFSLYILRLLPTDAYLNTLATVVWKGFIARSQVPSVPK
jgi:hypothetical protein